MMSLTVHIVEHSRQNISGKNGEENEREVQEVGTGQRRKEKCQMGGLEEKDENQLKRTERAQELEYRNDKNPKSLTILPRHRKSRMICQTMLPQS